MKKLSVILMLAIILMLSMPTVAFANMAAPAQSDIGSSISFEKHDTISVLSEILNIRVDGAQADIEAIYKMKNTSDMAVSTQAMFLSPNFENNNISVVVNGKVTPYTVQSYALGFNQAIGELSDWQNAQLTDIDKIQHFEDEVVASTIFTMDFLPNEEFEVVVSYRYNLGGYPNHNFDAKNGIINYYLAPASMWKDFSNLTINLYLDEDMPVIKSSNLEFEKVGTRTFKYTSDRLTTDTLTIVIDENFVQNIFSTLRSPYLLMFLPIFAPFIIIIAAIIVAVVIVSRKKKKNQVGIKDKE